MSHPQSTHRWPLTIRILFGAFAVLTILVVVSVLLAPPNLGLAAAKGHGLTDARVTDRDYFFGLSFKGCGHSDVIRVEVTGVDARGESRRVFACIDQGLSVSKSWVVSPPTK